MTLPDERYRAVQRTREFLRSLLDPRKTKRVPRYIRLQAYWCLKHFPSDYHLGKPEEFSEVSPYSYWENTKEAKAKRKAKR